ncbi:ankyrin repeat domain-containing protein [Streptomyces sp. RY43-2]|uniref:Ankyrin repeat domain-containing protein n=1 Tax=Streptomyces macrolidinus TaxID=2952607 RepID=A0ABT0ZKC4_9ACTN|nr:ankyrin repeat domain-containing protein [Streptomyces macrolidinus]MCN9244048.1 ankyrin repeat domain-containing protein [Streptomyces macrolidinus]
MDFDELLECLADAESGNLRPELTSGRFLVVTYVPGGGSGAAELAEIYGDPAESADRVDAAAGDEECCSFGVVGIAASFYEALDVLGEELGCDEETLAELDEELDLEDDEDDEDFEDDEGGMDGQEGQDDEDGHADAHRGSERAAVLTRIRSPRRRAVAHLLIGGFGPMDVVWEDFEEDVYLGHVAAHLPGARFVMLASAAPPNQELAFAILELQPAGTPEVGDRALLLAAAAGDPTALCTLISDGADVNALDEHGATPLHHAVAACDVEAVHALLAAGADPRAQLAFGNAPQFAAADRKGRPHPVSRRVQGEEHWTVLWPLLDAGADINAVNTSGKTLLDLAISSQPYPEGEVRRLVKRGAVSRELRNVSVDSLVTHLPYGYEEDLRILKNQARFLLDIGAPYSHPLDALLAVTGYYEHEVSGDYLAELVDIMVNRGVEDRPGTYDRTARESAQFWVDRGLTHYQAVVDRLATMTDDIG